MASLQTTITEQCYGSMVKQGVNPPTQSFLMWCMCLFPSGLLCDSVALLVCFVRFLLGSLCLCLFFAWSVLLVGLLFCGGVFVFVCFLWFLWVFCLVLGWFLLRFGMSLVWFLLSRSSVFSGSVVVFFFRRAGVGSGVRGLRPSPRRFPACLFVGWGVWRGFEGLLIHGIVFYCRL